MVNHATKMIVSRNEKDEERMITVDEWIAQELTRIEEKQPRHCQDYEALIEVIEDFGCVPGVMYLQSSVKSDSACSSVGAQSLSRSLSPPSSSPTFIMVPLVQAFISLLEYCWDRHYSPHHPCPVSLLLEMEKVILCLIPDHDHHENYSIAASNKNEEKNADSADIDNDDTSTKTKKVERSFFARHSPRRHQHITSQLNKMAVIRTPESQQFSHTLSSSCQVIQQWVVTLLSLLMHDTAAWNDRLMMGVHAYHSAKFNFNSYMSTQIPHFDQTNVTNATHTHTTAATIQHLEQLMQETHI